MNWFFTRQVAPTPATAPPPPSLAGSDLRFLSYAAVVEHSVGPELVSEMAQALASPTAQVVVPAMSVVVDAAEHKIFLAMTALDKETGLYIGKIGSIFARQPGAPVPGTQSVVVAFSETTGSPIAVLDGAAITKLKSIAVATLVTSRCARPESRVLAIMGAGVQARHQLAGVLAARPIHEVRVYNRSKDRLDGFLRDARRRHPDAEIREASSIEHAIDGADIVATATSCGTPAAEFSEVPRWVHINCMGAHTRTSRELPHSFLRASRVIVEDVATAVAEAGDVHRGALDLPAMLRQPAEALQQTRTVFSSTGFAWLDLLTVAHVLRRCPRSIAP